MQIKGVDASSLEVWSDALFSESSGIYILQSYQFLDNSCFLDTGLELWFQAFIAWSPESREMFLKEIRFDGSVLAAIFRNFRARLSWILASRSIDESSQEQAVDGIPGHGRGHGRGRGRGQGKSSGRGRGRGHGKGRGQSRDDTPGGGKSSSNPKGKEVIYSEDAGSSSLERGFEILKTTQIMLRTAAEEWGLVKDNGYGSTIAWMSQAIWVSCSIIFLHGCTYICIERFRRQSATLLCSPTPDC